MSDNLFSCQRQPSVFLLISILYTAFVAAQVTLKFSHYEVSFSSFKLDHFHITISKLFKRLVFQASDRLSYRCQANNSLELNALTLGKLLLLQ